MRTILLLCLGVILPLAATAAGPDIRIPDLPSADMRISWTDFKELLQLIQTEKIAVAPGVEKKKPPVPWSLLDAHYDVDATTPDSVAITATLGLHVWSEDWERIPVLGEAVALESATLDGAPCFLARDGGKYTLLIDEPGTHELVVKFHLRATAKEGVVSFEAPVTPTPVTRMNLHLAESKAVVTAPMAAGIRSVQSDDGLNAELVFQSTDTLAVSWKLPAAPIPPEPVAPKIAPRLSCMTTTLATVSENFVSYESQLHFELLRGEVNAFAFALPAELQVLGVEGKGLAWESEGAGQSQTININLNYSVSDRYVLHLRSEAPIPADAKSLTFPAIRVNDALRQTGFVAIASSGNVELGVDPQLEQIQRVDLGDLPAALVQQSVHPILHAFQYQDPGYLLALDYHRLEDVPVRVAGIDSARLTTVLTEEGMVVNKAAYTIRNHHKKFLRVEIGADAEVWSARVGGELVRPARNDDDDVVLIPLRKSSPNAPDGGGFAVELVYMAQREAVTGWQRELAFHAPQPDLLANRFEWEIWTPDGQAVYRSEGDVDPADIFENPLALFSGIPEAERMEEQTIYRLREGIERFFITDINNPAASATAQSGDYSRYDGQHDPARATPPGDVQVAGVVPIAMDVPVTGKRHNFRRTVVPENAPLTITLHTVDRRLVTVGRLTTQTAALLLAFLAAYVFARRILSQTLKRKHVLAMGLVLTPVLLAWTATEGPLRDGLARPALVGALLGTALVILPTLGAWVQRQTGTRALTNEGVQG